MYISSSLIQYGLLLVDDKPIMYRAVASIPVWTKCRGYGKTNNGTLSCNLHLNSSVESIVSRYKVRDIRQTSSYLISLEM